MPYWLSSAVETMVSECGKSMMQPDGDSRLMSEMVSIGTSEPTNQSDANRSSWSDWLGMVASIACAVHCAAMPFVIASLPALGLSFLADESFHQWMAVACFGIAIAAFVPGWRRHGSWLPGAVGLVGIIFIGGAAFGMPGECCASCETSLPDTVSVNTISEEESCECCVVAANESPDGSTSTPILRIASLAGMDPAALTPLLSWAAPWLTPIGGLILVAAHLLNRRFGCACGSCDEPLPQAAE